MKSARLVATVTIAAILTAAGPALLPSPASAAPGGDATVVVSTFTLSAADLQATASVMCPDGARALGGGAAPVAPQSSLDQYYRTFYSAPLDATGLAGQTMAGDVPRGWMVSVGHNTVLDESYKIFVICSSTSDAVLATADVPNASLMVGTASCPVGSRAVGGGLGKNSDTPIPSDTQGPYLRESGPVDAGGTVSGTVDDDAPVGWRSVTSSSPYGNRFFAVCSAQTDAFIRAASHNVSSSPAVGSATVTCPAGTRAVSGGDQVAGPADSDDRMGHQGPYPSGQAAQVNTGAVAREWTSSSRGSASGTRSHKVMVVCVTDAPAPPPTADTTPPDTTITKSPGKKTFSTKATFKFSAEAGATFTCKLDKKKAKACSSPYKLKKLKVGKHKVTITAQDAAGNIETKPATYKWKVVKKP
jgi:hypothetical protein